MNVQAHITSIDGFDFDHSAIPSKNILALLNSAIGHKMRNETSSKVVSQLRTEAVKALGENASEEDKEAARKSVKYDDENEAHKALKKAAQAAMAQVILHGEIGESTRAPSQTPLEAEISRIVRDRVIAVLVGKGILDKGRKLPKPDQTFATNKGVRTFADMCEGYYNVNRASVDKDAQASLDRKAREAAKLQAEAAKSADIDF